MSNLSQVEPGPLVSPQIGCLGVPQLEHLLLQVAQDEQREKAVDQVDPQVCVQGIRTQPVGPQESPEHHGTHHKPRKPKEHVQRHKDQVDHQQGGGAVGQEESQNGKQHEGHIGITADLEPGGQVEGDLGVGDEVVRAGEVLVGEVEVPHDEGDHGQEDQIGVAAGGSHSADCQDIATPN